MSCPHGSVRKACRFCRSEYNAWYWANRHRRNPRATPTDNPSRPSNVEAWPRPRGEKRIDVAFRRWKGGARVGLLTWRIAA